MAIRDIKKCIHIYKTLADIKRTCYESLVHNTRSIVDHNIIIVCAISVRFLDVEMQTNRHWVMTSLVQNLSVNTSISENLDMSHACSATIYTHG
jgi:hypothetical protein